MKTRPAVRFRDAAQTVYVEQRGGGPQQRQGVGQQREQSDGYREPDAGTLRTPQKGHEPKAEARRDVEIQKAQVEDQAVGDHGKAGGDDPAAVSGYGGHETESSPEEDFDCG